MYFVKKRINNVPNLLFIHLFVCFFEQNSGRLEESPASIDRSLARGGEDERDGEVF